MRIFLVRHGETDWNLQGRCQGVTDIELNDSGRRQAEEIAGYLNSEKIHAIYSSDLKRALKTAEIIAAACNLRVTVDGDFRELDHGVFEGLTFADIRASYPDFLARWRTEPAGLLIPGGERLVDVEKRAWNAMEGIARRHSSDKTVVVVSHNFPILAVLCRIRGVPLDEYRSFRVGPCGLSRIGYDPETGWSVLQADGAGDGAARPREKEAGL